MCAFIILQNRMTNFQLNYKYKVQLNSVKIYQHTEGGKMDEKSEKYYRGIIQIMDSEEQQQQIKKKEAKPKKSKFSSEVKSKPSNFFNMQNDNQWSNRSCVPLQKPSNSIQFQDVLHFKDIQMTNNLNDHLGNLKKFIENSQKNVLFVFGPSGCGKTLMTLIALTESNLNYQFVQEKVEQNQYGENIYEDVIDMQYRIFSVQDKIRQKIYISKDYPTSTDEMSTGYSLKYKIYKENAYDLISNISNRNKYIFLLNSQIYSSYYLLSEASENRSILQLKNVSVIKMEAYGPRDLKKIINRFISNNSDYSTVTNQGKVLDEIVTEANGDARKALNIIYYKKIREIGRLNPNKNAGNKSQIRFYDDPKEKRPQLQSKKKGQLGTFNHFIESEQPEQEKQQIKVGIFHALGKLLYGKRYNIYYNPHDKKNKKTNNISCIYTQQEIDRLNPKFYFKPVELVEKSHLNMNVCADLLEENFLNRYGKIKDITKMYGIFRYFDSYLEDTLSKYQVKEQMQEHLKQLLYWGIIVYNKNSVKDNSFVSFQRSKNNIPQKIIKKKDQLIKIYYLRLKDSLTTVKYNKKDIIELGYLLQTKNNKIFNNYSIFLQKLIEIVFDSGRRTIGSLEKEVNVIQDEQQEVAGENCTKLNKIAEMLTFQMRKKERLFEMMVEDSEESDIDSD